MALVVEIEEGKTASDWKEYKDDQGNVVARFKIRGIEHDAYQIAQQRISHQLSLNCLNIHNINESEKTLQVLNMEACACHLIEDWEGISFKIDGELIEVGYSSVNAIKLLKLGKIGAEIYLFILNEAQKIEQDAKLFRQQVLGK